MSLSATMILINQGGDIKNMAHENWQQVKEVFVDALRQKPEEREKFLDRVCSNDETLRREVETLLSSHDSAKDFMESPAVGEFADDVLEESRKFADGQKIQHYEIIQPIGAGGMGDVYLAQDTKLDRRVALKVLRKNLFWGNQAKQRLLREARAVAKLEHPNICAVYEISESEDWGFIVMQYVEGETLVEILAENRLSVEKSLDLAVQIADALSEAHAQQIIHRDIKPANIIINNKGQLKVLDFGLAKFVEPDDEQTKNLSGSGAVMGTVPFMSPEQLRGETLDAQTDIFSFGVLFYEMLSGISPFQKGSSAETISAILNNEPDLSKIPSALQPIVQKLLMKEKEKRYQTADDLLSDLRNLQQNATEKINAHNFKADSENYLTTVRELNYSTDPQPTITTDKSSVATTKQRRQIILLTVGVLGAICLALFIYYNFRSVSSINPNEPHSIAVLPLKPLTAEKRDPIYELGIADSLILKLSAAKNLTVRPLSATQQYIDSKKDAVAIGKEQKVDYVLASNYQIADGKLKITSQLINVENGAVEETFKGEQNISDAFAMQDAIAGDVGNKLLARFSATENNLAAKRGTTNKEAYLLYLQGLRLLDQRRQKGQKALENFEQAVKLDPNYALAWAAIARNSEYQKSIEAANKALALDPNLSEAYSALCWKKLIYAFDFAGAERDCRRAVELDPNSPTAHNTYSTFLASRGQFDEAIAEIRTAIDLDPTSYFNQRVYANVLYFARRYEEAVPQYKKLLELNDEAGPTYQWLIRTLEAQGNESEAYEWFLKSLTLQKQDNETIQRFKTAYQKSGWQGVLLERDRTANGNYFRRAGWSARLGNKDKAFEYLEKSYQEHEWLVPFLQVEPQLDSLRDDPRFDELVRRVGLK